MYSTSWYKKLLRPLGIELKRFAFGMDPWADLSLLFERNPAKVIFDVGANRGQTSLQLASLCLEAKIWAFEPNPNLFPKLEKKVSRYERIMPMQMALGDRQTTLPLHIMGSDLNSSLLHYAREDGQDRMVQTVEVPVTTLDLFCKEKRIAPINLLKTDVQGFDLQVMKGAQGLFERDQIHAVFCEINIHKMYEHQGSFEETYAFLFANGFRLCGLYDLIREKGFHIHWCDALFIRPEHFPRNLV